MNDIKLRALVGPNNLGPETLVELRREAVAGAGQPPLRREAARFLEAAFSGRGLTRLGETGLDTLGWAALMARLVAIARRAAELPERSAIVVDRNRCVAFPTEDRTLGRACVELAMALLSWGQSGGAHPPQSLDTMLEGFRNQVEWLGFGRHGLVIMEACARLGVPFRRHSTLAQHIIVGEGAGRIVMDMSDTQFTAAMGKTTVANKDLAHGILAANGMPVARQAVVTNAAEAWQAARGLGTPVVVKPRVGSQGKGVTLGVSTQEEMNQAFAAARAECEQVLVESTLPGDDHRIMVARGQVPVALRRTPPQLIGDGATTIAALIERANKALDRAGHQDTPRFAVRPDTARQLARAGYTLETILPQGQAFVLTTIPDGTWPREDVGPAMHPDNRAMLARAVALFDLDIASVDFRCPDISRSWREVGGGICEIETGSGLMAAIRADHLLVDRLLRCLLAGRRAHMHHVAVCAVHDDLAQADTAAQAIAETLSRGQGWRMALSTSRGLWLDGYGVGQEPLPPIVAYLRAVESPLVDAGVYVCPAEAALGQGLGVERPSLAILLETQSANGLAKIEAVRSMLKSCRIRVETAANADQAASLAATLSPIPPFQAEGQD